MINLLYDFLRMNVGYLNNSGFLKDSDSTQGDGQQITLKNSGISLFI